MYIIYDRKFSGLQSKSYVWAKKGLRQFSTEILLRSHFLGETLVADRSERIDCFLRREKEFQQWRIQALLKCGALELTREGAKSALANETDKIKNGDQIELKSPLPQPYNNALQNIPETDYRDYAFANPTPADDYEKGVIEYLGLHPQTTLLSNTSVDSLTSFIRALKKDDRLTHPIRHLVIASHASRTGRLALHLTTGSALKEITFEDLEAAVISKALGIDPQLLEPRPKNASGKVIATQLHIKGCNIGNPIAMPFLQLLKKALGGKVGLTAPKFFHSLKMVDSIKKRGRTVISRKRVEIWEFFSYEFTLFRTSKLSNKADAVAAFKAAPTLKRIDGSKIPQTDWERWTPRTLPGENKVAIISVPVTTTLSSKANDADGQFRYRKTFFLGKEWHTSPLASDPGTDAKRKEEIKKKLHLIDNRFSGAHPFPIYARTGFKSIDDYFDSYDWKFKPFDRTKKELSFSGTRHEYTVLAPIVDPSTNELFMNLFPVSGSPTIQLTESDARFFTSL